MQSLAFGVPEHRIRDGYGMAEHSAPYFECKKHQLHVPVFNHLIIRDPETMDVLPPGEVGILELISPFEFFIVCIHRSYCCHVYCEYKKFPQNFPQTPSHNSTVSVVAK